MIPDELFCHYNSKRRVLCIDLVSRIPNSSASFRISGWGEGLRVCNAHNGAPTLLEDVSDLIIVPGQSENDKNTPLSLFAKEILESIRCSILWIRYYQIPMLHLLCSHPEAQELYCSNRDLLCLLTQHVYSGCAPIQRTMPVGASKVFFGSTTSKVHALRPAPGTEC